MFIEDYNYIGCFIIAYDRCKPSIFISYIRTVGIDLSSDTFRALWQQLQNSLGCGFDCMIQLLRHNGFKDHMKKNGFIDRLVCYDTKCHSNFVIKIYYDT